AARDADAGRDRRAVADDSADAKAIRNTLATAVNNALTRRGASNLNNALVEHDRARQTKTTAAVDWNDVDKKVDEFNKAWRDKYGRPLGVEDNQVAFGADFARIYHGRHEARL